MPSKKPTKKYNYTKKPGRPTKYKPEYCEEITKFFDVPAYFREEGKLTPNDLPFFEQFARKLDICVDTLKEWRDKYPDFSSAYKKAKEKQEENWKVCSLLGLYSPAFTIFFGKNVFHWKDRHDHNVSGNLNIIIQQFSESDLIGN